VLHDGGHHHKVGRIEPMPGPKRDRRWSGSRAREGPGERTTTANTDIEQGRDSARSLPPVCCYGLRCCRRLASLPTGHKAHQAGRTRGAGQFGDLTAVATGVSSKTASRVPSSARPVPGRGPLPERSRGVARQRAPRHVSTYRGLSAGGKGKMRSWVPST
jgi:hypothetical protein